MSVAIGALLGYPGWVLGLGMACYALFHLYHVHKIEHWLNTSNRSSLYPPDGVGIWSTVFDHLYREQIKKRSDKRRVSDMLRRFRESTGAMPDGVIVLQGYSIEWFNDAARRLLSLEGEDVGQRIDNLLRDPHFAKYLSKAAFTTPVDLSAPKLDDVLLQINIIPYTEHEKLMLIRDITQLRSIETIRKDFIANASHELRTPLTVVRGYVDMMQQDKAQFPDVWTAGIDSMSAQVRRMEMIIKDLLELNRLESEPMNDQTAVVSVGSILQSVVEDVRQLSSEHQVYLDIDESLGLYGNQDELYSLFSNLVSNAVKYSPEGGDIVVLWQTNSSGKPQFSVSDNGIGIPPEHMARLTERFYRVHDTAALEVSGTGLGLAIVKHVLDRHEGRLRIRSEVSSGSTFSCTFPQTRAAHDVMQDQPSYV